MYMYAHVPIIRTNLYERNPAACSIVSPVVSVILPISASCMGCWKLSEYQWCVSLPEMNTISTRHFKRVSYGVWREYPTHVRLRRLDGTHPHCHVLYPYYPYHGSPIAVEATTQNGRTAALISPTSMDTSAVSHAGRQSLAVDNS